MRCYATWKIQSMTNLKLIDCPKIIRIIGAKALKRVTNWIRKSVREIAKRTKEVNSEQIAELSRYLPLTESDGPLDLNADGEKSFDKYGNITKSRIKVRTYPSPIYDLGDEDEEEDDDENGTGSGGGKWWNGYRWKRHQFRKW